MQIDIAYEPINKNYLPTFWGIVSRNGIKSCQRFCDRLIGRYGTSFGVVKIFIFYNHTGSVRYSGTNTYIQDSDNTIQCLHLAIYFIVYVIEYIREENLSLKINLPSLLYGCLLHIAYTKVLRQALT